MNERLTTARKWLVEIGDRLDKAVIHDSTGGQVSELARTVNQLVGVFTDVIDFIGDESGFWLRYVGQYNDWPEFSVYWNGVKRGSIRRWNVGREWVAFPRGDADALHLGSFQACILALRKHVE